MDGFKNSTRTQYMKGGSCQGYAKGGSVKGAAKISKVMGEFKAGTLHSGSKKGPEVTSKKQATAIALSEARKAGAKIPQPVQKKSLGGVLKAIAPAAAGALGAAGAGGAPLLGGLAGLALSQLLKKKQAGTITPAEDKQLAAQQAQQTTMQKGGKVVKKGNGGMLESTSARPQKIGPTPEEKASGAAVARGNRMQALEAREEAKLMREKRPAHQTEGERRRLMTEGELGRRSKAVPVASREPKVRNPLMDRLTQLPSQRGEFPVRKAGGGLAAMPKGKKC